MKRILITGSSGFIGANLFDYLSKGEYEIVGFGRKEIYKNNKMIYTNTHELNAENLIKYAANSDIIIHCAGGASVANAQKFPDIDYQNTIGTLNSVLFFIKNYCNAKLIYLSSAAVYGVNENLKLQENIDKKPISVYGKHKAMAEDICLDHSMKYGLNINILRPFSIIGKNLKKQLFWDACQKMKNGNFSFFGSGNEFRDYLDVEDLCRLIKILCESVVRDNVINGGSGVGVRIKDALQILLEEYPFNGSPIFIGESKNGDPKSLVADISRAQNLGWQPKISLNQSIKNYIKWEKSV